jgi:anti-anti-sigma factor
MGGDAGAIGAEPPLPVAHLTGEIDLRNAPSLFVSLGQGWAPAGGVLDLTDVTFIDSWFVGQLVNLNRRWPVRLVAPMDGQPRRVLHLTRLVDVIPTFETVTAALAGP